MNHLKRCILLEEITSCLTSWGINPIRYCLHFVCMQFDWSRHKPHQRKQTSLYTSLYHKPTNSDPVASSNYIITIDITIYSPMFIMVSPFFEGLGSSWASKQCPRRSPRCALPMRCSPRWRSIRASRREMDIPCRIAVAPWIGEATVVREPER